MALTEEEKKTARAYNMGYLLASYEPKLLAEVIKRNPNNEFVKAMQIGQDHQEFHANIPRNDYTREFKNGFYNGRALAEHSPEVIDRLLGSKGLRKDYKKGLESAQKEFAIRSIQKKMNQEPKAPVENLRKDASFQKGYNVGYRLSEDYGSALKHAEFMNDKYSNFMEGIKSGKQQYEFDLSELREKDPKGRLFGNDPERSPLEQSVVENKLFSINDITSDQQRVVDRHEEFQDVPAPKWLQKKIQDKDGNSPQKDKGKDIDEDR